MNKSILLFFTYLIFSGCNTDSDCYSVRKPAAYTLQFEVTGTATLVDILFIVENVTADTTRIEDTTLPWSREIVKEGDTWIYIAVQNQDSLGTVSTALFVNEEEVARETGGSPYSITSISYTVLAEDYMINVLECP